MRTRSWAAGLAVIMLLSATTAWAAKKKKPEKEVTQVLDLPKDPPAAIVVDASRLSFHIAPLSAKGLLSQQVRDGVKALWSSARGASIVKIRAFVAGSGDMRRVPQIVSEMFSDKRLALPAVSVVQVGGLPLVGSQVALEAAAVEKKASTPNGIAFLSGQASTVQDAAGPLVRVVQSSGLETDSVRRVTCFLNSLEKVNDVRARIASAFPKAAANFVQLQRDSAGDFIECEAVAALATAPPKPLFLMGSKPKQYSDVALVAPGKVAFTGTQLAFRQQDEDIHLAFDRLGKALESVGGDYKLAAAVNIYPLSRNVADKVRAVRFQYFDPQQPPASTLLLFEGLPSLDASFAVEVVTLVSP